MTQGVPADGLRERSLLAIEPKSCLEPLAIVSDEAYQRDRSFAHLGGQRDDVVITLLGWCIENIELPECSQARACHPRLVRPVIVGQGHLEPR